MHDGLIGYERRDALAVLTLNRPEKLNAINAAMIDGLHRALDTAEADEDVRVVILAGAGRAFSSGFDLDMETGGEGRPDALAVRRALENDFRIIMRFWDCPKVTVAAVHRYCLGSAMELAVACDLTIAADDCVFGAPEVRFGSGIVAMLLPWLAGPKRAKQLLLTGEDRLPADTGAADGAREPALCRPTGSWTRRSSSAGASPRTTASPSRSPSRRSTAAWTWPGCGRRCCRRSSST